jgi:hypothetical protein
VKVTLSWVILGRDTSGFIKLQEVLNSAKMVKKRIFGMQSFPVLFDHPRLDRDGALEI